MKTLSRNRALTVSSITLLVAAIGWQHWQLGELKSQLSLALSANKLIAAQAAGVGPNHPDFKNSGPPGSSRKNEAAGENAVDSREGEPQTLRQPRRSGFRVVDTSRTGTAQLLPGAGSAADGNVSGFLSEPMESAVFVEPLPAQTSGLDSTGKPASWSHRQAVGAADTQEAGDIPTAWAPRQQDAGEEWLQLKYAKAADISQINIHETHNPGAVSKVTAFLPDGTEKVIWEGVEPGGAAPVEASIPVPPGIRSDQIKVYLDTSRVAGWNEIDAVEIVGTDGTRQWAAESSASSYYGDQSQSAFAYERATNR